MNGVGVKLHMIRGFEPHVGRQNVGVIIKIFENFYFAAGVE